MLTPREVTSVVFEKAVFGGYEIGSVDKFLNQLTKDYSSLYRDNELLKNRLSAMADKIEEYRANEDAMRLALLSAKKTAKELAEKAKVQEAADMAVPEQSLDEPEARARLRALAAELEKEETALRRAKEATATYLLRFREATSACEAALTDLYGEPIPEKTVPEDTADVSSEAAGEAEEPDMIDLDFAGLNFSRN